MGYDFITGPELTKKFRSQLIQYLLNLKKEGSS